MRSLLDAVGAILASVIPRRHWGRIDLGIADWATLSGLLTLLSGCALGITGYYAYMTRTLESAYFVPSPYMMVSYFAYVFFTPQGLFSLYLVGSGLARAVSAWMDEPFGDPLLTGVDTLMLRLRGTRATRLAGRERLRSEGADEADRRYPGEWAGLPAADFVIVSARRKAGWTAGTFVVTDDGWFTLGEPFDRPTPNGLRTVYPLSALRTLEVLRKGVPYELPPLRPFTPRRGPADGPSRPPNES